MAQTEYDLCVIGGGAAGLVVAAGGASLGAKVVLIEKHLMGGDCLHFGCVPSKTLLQSAKVAHTIADAGRFGVGAQRPEVDIPSVMGRVAEVIKGIEPNDSPERFRSLGVEVILGSGEFIGKARLLVTEHETQASEIKGHEVKSKTITARHFVIATGSRAAIPPIDGIDTVPVFTNESIFSIKEKLPRLIILGGGPIGMEMAQAFTRLGSQVQLVQRGPQVLANEDPELAEVVANRLRAEGAELLVGHTPLRVEGEAGDIRMIVKGPDGEEKTIRGSHLLVAAGRRPNVESLGLEAAGVELNKGRIVTDQRLRTTNKRIFAAGDVVGSYQFTHMAEHHAGVVLRNTLFRLPAKVEQRVIPWATFTDPELARVGLSETEARAQGIKHKVYSFPFAEVDRARADGVTEGFARIITDPKGRLLGAAIVGPHAGEMIHEYVLAIAKKMKAADLSAIMHIYPTLAQINRRVADARMKEGLTPTARKWIKRIFRLRGG